MIQDDGIRENQIDGIDINEFVMNTPDPKDNNNDVMIKQLNYPEDLEGSVFDEIRERLIKDLGLPVYEAVYKIIKQNSHTKWYNCNEKELTLKIYSSLRDYFKLEVLNQACEKISEIYTVIYNEDDEKNPKN